MRTNDQTDRLTDNVKTSRLTRASRRVTKQAHRRERDRREGRWS